ncbi:MAG: NAD-dependent epimerase/dehydratase family protein [Thermaerobacter sp.]|nr:NAD-dependent epimerase/dehydratase family protein [Thermaerobacter sp.]
MNIVVTGGAGFVGRSLVRWFHKQGHHLTVVDRLPYRGGLAVDVVQGDLRDPDVVDQSLASDTDAVIHLAAMTYVLKSKERPHEVFENNVLVTQSLLERTRQLGIRHFVFASTNAVAGDHGEDVIDETSTPNPLTPYGATKAAAEMLINGYRHSYGLLATTLRFTNAYGVGMEFKDSVVPRFVRAIRAGDPVTVYGDGTQVRDYVYVSDMCRAFELALTKDFAGTLCIGYGRSYSVLDLVAKLEAVAGRRAAINFVPPKPGEMPAVRVAPVRARESLGWRAEVGLDEGLARVWEDLKTARP